MGADADALITPDEFLLAALHDYVIIPSYRRDQPSVAISYQLGFLYSYTGFTIITPILSISCSDLANTERPGWHPSHLQWRGSSYFDLSFLLARWNDCQPNSAASSVSRERKRVDNRHALLLMLLVFGVGCKLILCAGILLQID